MSHDLLVWVAVAALCVLALVRKVTSVIAGAVLAVAVIVAVGVVALAAAGHVPMVALPIWTW
jgi:hypothetical protein